MSTLSYPSPILLTLHIVFDLGSASLVQESIESEFRSFDDFQTCKIPAKEACLASGGAAQTFWLSSIANR